MQKPSSHNFFLTCTNFTNLVLILSRPEWGRTSTEVAAPHLRPRPRLRYQVEPVGVLDKWSPPGPPQPLYRGRPKATSRPWYRRPGAVPVPVRVLWGRTDQPRRSTSTSTKTQITLPFLWVALAFIFLHALNL